MSKSGKNRKLSEYFYEISSFEWAKNDFSDFSTKKYIHIMPRWQGMVLRDALRLTRGLIDGTGFGAILWTMPTKRQINFTEFLSEENEAVYFGTKLVDPARKH